MRLYYILAPLLLLFLLGCGEKEVEALGPEVEVVEARLTMTPGSLPEFSTTLVNTTTAVIRNLQLQVALYDTDNVFVQHMYVVVRNLEPGEEEIVRERVPTDLPLGSARIVGVLK